MPSKLNAYLLSAAMLAALLRCAPGAPLIGAVTVTDGPAGDTSGEDFDAGEADMSTNPPSMEWEWVIKVTTEHQKQFEEEFHNQVKYIFLDQYRVPSLPEIPQPSLSKEARLQSLAQGLLVYTVLLKHVEREYPGNSIPSVVRSYAGRLVSQIKNKMRNSEQVTAPSGGREEQLLRELGNGDSFQRRMTAHSILRSLHEFLKYGKREVINSREKPRRGKTTRTWQQAVSITHMSTAQNQL